jgi:hypothetical protein
MRGRKARGATAHRRLPPSGLGPWTRQHRSRSGAWLSRVNSTPAGRRRSVTGSGNSRRRRSLRTTYWVTRSRFCRKMRRSASLIRQSARVPSIRRWFAFSPRAHCRGGRYRGRSLLWRTGTEVVARPQAEADHRRFHQGRDARAFRAIQSRHLQSALRPAPSPRQGGEGPAAGGYSGSLRRSDGGARRAFYSGRSCQGRAISKRT